MQNDAIHPSNQGINSLSSGQKLAGCYVLTREISSEGGLSVWLAQDEVLGKEVTLHFVPSEVLGDPRGMAELRQEVKRNRQLIHPNILRVYDFVEDAGLAAVSMDRFEGESLATVLARKGAFSASDIQPWIQQLAGTLDDAHRVQLVHRDLSPSNIFLKPGGGLFVTNFGVSRCIRDAMERTRSQQGDSLHLAYMSPQQVDGEKAAKSDDVYGLGVLATELLSGKTPFSGPDIVPTIRTATAPKVADLLGGPVPEAWEKMIAACLSKKPEQRPPGCVAAVAMLSAPSASSSESAAVVSVVPVASKILGETKQSTMSITPGAAAALSTLPVGGSSGAVTSESRTIPERRMTFGKSEIVPPSAEPKPSTSGEAAQSAADARSSEPMIAASATTQLPPLPPVDASKSKTGNLKSNLPANFPELSRPKSKWPAIGIGLAAGLVAFGVVKKLKPTADEGLSGAVTSVSPDASPIADSDPVVGTNPPTATELPKPEELPKPVALPTPESVKPVAKSVATNEPELNAAPVVNPPKAGAEAELPLPDATNAIAASGADAALIAENAEKPLNVKPPKKGLIGATPFPPQPKVVEKEPVPAKVEPKTPEKPVLEPAAQPKVTQVPNTVIAGASVKLPELPPMPPKLDASASADASAIEKSIAERVSAEAAIKQAATAAEQAQQEIAKQSESAKKAQEALRKSLEERRKANAPLLKENEALIVERKKLEDGLAKAEAAAAATRKAADAAKAALETLVQQSGAKLDATKKADDEMKQLALQIAEQAAQSEALNTSQTQAATLRQQTALALQQIEKEKTVLKALADKAKAGAAEAMRAQNMAKIAELAKQAQPLEAEIKKSSDALAMLKELGDAGVSASKPISERLAAATSQLQALRDEIAKLGGAGMPPVPPAPPAATPPPKTNPVPVEAAAPGANSIGMRFVQIDGVDFAVHLVTRRDFESFAADKGLKGGAWRSPGFAQEAEHPVVNVTWKEADAFCKWLTERERKSGQIKGGDSYRLPTDIEWSKAVGLPPEKGVTPEERDLGVDDVFPWGLVWPPPVGAGNYAGEETDSEVKLQGYRDDYQWTSPVGKFKANAFGLFDMGGNVWQWTNDFFNESKERRVLRGGSWYNGGVKPSLLASCRYSAKPDVSNDTYGFRVVRVREGAKTSAAKPK